MPLLPSVISTIVRLKKARCPKCRRDTRAHGTRGARCEHCGADLRTASERRRAIRQRARKAR